MKRLLLIGLFCALTCAAQTVSSAKIIYSLGSGSVFSMSSVNVPSGAAVWMFFGSQGSCTMSSITASSNTSADNSKFNQIGTTIQNPNGPYTCSAQFAAFNLTANATETFKFTVGGTVPSSAHIAVVVLTGANAAVDASAVGAAPSGSSVTSASMTLSASGVICAGVIDYYADTFSAGSGYTIPGTNGTSTGNGSGAVETGAFASGSRTASFGVTGSNFTEIMAAAFTAASAPAGTPVKRRIIN